VESCINKRKKEVRKKAEEVFAKIKDDINRLEENLYA
jgi:hypothetical protein